MLGIITTMISRQQTFRGNEITRVEMPHSMCCNVTINNVIVNFVAVHVYACPCSLARVSSHSQGHAHTSCRDALPTVRVRSLEPHLGLIPMILQFATCRWHSHSRKHNRHAAETNATAHPSRPTQGTKAITSKIAKLRQTLSAKTM